MIRARRWLTLVLLWACVPGCGPNDAQAGAPHEATIETHAEWEWPIDESGDVRQLTKHSEDLQRNSKLFLISDLPGGSVPAQNVDPLGIQLVLREDVERSIDTRQWRIVDVRKPSDVLRTGVIPGAVSFPYKYTNAKGEGQLALGKDVAVELLSQVEGIVLVCNGPK